MRTINKSRNFMAYAILATLALTSIFLISGPTVVIAGDGADPILPDTIPVGGSGDTTRSTNSIGSDNISPTTFDLILLIMETTIF